MATAERDGAWTSLLAASLVPGDVVKLSLGAVVPADVRLLEGSVLLDQSMLTGESIPIEASAGFDTYAGALVRRGEAAAIVTATGPRTRFGRTAELVRTAHVQSSQEKVVLRVVRNLAAFNLLVVLGLSTLALIRRLPLDEVVPLILTAILMAIPVALPATFTLAAALGARALARLGVLPTRLSAVDEAATMDVLCVDKTGTLTENELRVKVVRAMTGSDEGEVLGLAALASSEGGQDSIDAAIRMAAREKAPSGLPALTRFVAFDPATKMAEATATRPNGDTIRIVKGAFSVVAGKLRSPPGESADAMADELAPRGLRVLAVAAGPEGALALVGLIALSDRPRSDSAGLIAKLRGLGVRTLMVTGDAPPT
jgi:H+-transporting ATPase